ncbi:uncharacterized protein LOC118187607 isoform X5 [Stegodyphus dumicola]|uniref:uncharacterized protein LOC118187607 isoform X5 n=1 Tax=Stegodyphus dumicola TaxID=202533 RepID=UPI0015AD589C|nr:uncharacterized protein LOC118187607 isoform X5 [Stegodyphus dumicola]
MWFLLFAYFIALSSVKSYVECMHKYSKACNIKIFPAAGEYESINSLVSEVCDKDTLLHKAYLLSAPCYEYAVYNLSEVCFEPVAELFYDIEVQMALDSLHTPHKNPEYLGTAKLKCLENVVIVSCVAEYAAINCLTYAGQATVEIARRSYYVTDCPTETVKELLIALWKLDTYRPLKNSLIRTLEGITF